MKKIERLFDCIEYQLQHFPKDVMLAAKANGTWKKYSTTEVKEIVNNLSAGLLQLGVIGNDMTATNADKIGIISNNRPEWMMLDMAVQQIGAILIPIYPTTNATELTFILNDASVKYVFVSDEALLHKVVEVQPNLTSLIKVFSFNKLSNVLSFG